MAAARHARVGAFVALCVLAALLADSGAHAASASSHAMSARKAHLFRGMNRARAGIVDIGGIIDKGKEVVGGAIDKGKEVGGAVIDKGKELLGDVKDTVEEIANKAKDLVLSVRDKAADAALKFEARPASGPVKDKLIDLLTHTLSYALAPNCDAKALEKWDCGYCKFSPGVTELKTFSDPSTNTFGFVGVDKPKKQIVVAFRGTQFGLSEQNLRDIANDLTIAPSKPDFPGAPKGAWVHGGFNAAYAHVRPGVTAHIRKLVSQNPGSTIIVTGHSKGGALATLCGADIKANKIAGNLRVRVITFGSPRVGGEGFVNWFRTLFTITPDDDSNSYRVVNFNDMIPQLPPLGMDFRHVPREIWLKGMNLRICNGDSNDPTCSIQNKLPYWSFASHGKYLNQDKVGC